MVHVYFGVYTKNARLTNEILLYHLETSVFQAPDAVFSWFIKPEFVYGKGNYFQRSLR